MNLDKLRRPRWIDRFAEPSQGLIKAAAEFGTKAQGERRPGFCRQFPNCLKTEDAKAVHEFLGQAEGGDRQIEDRPGALARRDDEDRTRGKTRQRMSGAPAVGERGAGGDARSFDPLDHIPRHGVFAAKEMRRAENIDDDAVRRVGGGDRRIAFERPKGEALERFGVGGGIGVLDDEAARQRLRLGHGHADIEARGSSGSVRGHNHAPSPVPADEHERRLSRRRGGAQSSSDPIRGPGRQEERDDPCHRRPPLQNRRSRRRDSGSIRDATSRVRPPGPAKGLKEAR